jgi:hypothetical protein
VNVGGVIRDAATVSGLINPTNTGTVTFRLYSDSNCANQVFTSTTPLTLTSATSGTATSGDYTTTAPGTYRFRATYNGDANNVAVGPNPCNEPAEAVVVGPAGPSIVTRASPTVPVGGSISDTATLSGGVSPTGTITFTLFGPDNATCSGTPIFTSTKAVNGNGDVTSDSYTTTAAGTYRWVARYSGDGNNAAAGPTACNDPFEQTVGTKITPGIVTRASAAVPAGGAISDTATLSNAFNPTGTITFTVFGPNNATCSGTPAFTSTKTVTGNGNVTSDAFTVTQAGTYRWVARYSGDNNNNAVVTACNDPLESVVVAPRTITITTAATGGVTVGGPVGDTAIISGGQNPTGTVTFRLYGPDDATCARPAAFTTSRPVTGNGTYTSDMLVPTVPGVYRWVASYSGDANNAAVTSGCNEPGESVQVFPRPSIAIVKTASPLTRVQPGGTFTFNFVVTNTSGVEVIITSLVDNIYGNLNGRGTCAVGAVLAPSPGPGNTYSCAINGDFFGNAGASQTDTVTVLGVDRRNNPVDALARATVGITPVLPTIAIQKTPTPTTRPEPGGTFQFDLVITNTGPNALTITDLVDNIYGNLNGRGSCAVGAVLASNAAYRCAFNGDFTGRSGDAQTDTVTVGAVDNFNQRVTARAEARVSLTPAPPGVAPLVVARTGSDVGGPARLAAGLLVLGLLMLASTWRYNNNRPALARVGPSGSRRPQFTPRRPSAPTIGGASAFTGGAAAAPPVVDRYYPMAEPAPAAPPPAPPAARAEPVVAEPVVAEPVVSAAVEVVEVVEVTPVAPAAPAAPAAPLASFLPARRVDDTVVLRTLIAPATPAPAPAPAPKVDHDDDTPDDDGPASGSVPAANPPDADPSSGGAVAMAPNPAPTASDDTPAPESAPADGWAARRESLNSKLTLVVGALAEVVVDSQTRRPRR